MGKRTKIIFTWVLIILLVVVCIGFFYSGGNDVQEVGVGSMAPKGVLGAENVIVEFFDFECPACAAAAPGIDNLVNERDDVVLYYGHFPLTNIHDNALNAAETSACANEQGMFWEYHDLLFNNQRNLDEPALKGYAVQLGLDEEEFNECLDSDEYLGVVQEDFEAAQELGVGGTPSFFVNGELVLGFDRAKIESLLV